MHKSSITSARGQRRHKLRNEYDAQIFAQPTEDKDWQWQSEGGSVHSMRRHHKTTTTTIYLKCILTEKTQQNAQMRACVCQRKVCRRQSSKISSASLTKISVLGEWRLSVLLLLLLVHNRFFPKSPWDVHFLVVPSEWRELGQKMRGGRGVEEGGITQKYKRTNLFASHRQPSQRILSLALKQLSHKFGCKIWGGGRKGATRLSKNATGQKEQKCIRKFVRDHIKSHRFWRDRNTGLVESQK